MGGGQNTEKGDGWFGVKYEMNNLNKLFIRISNRYKQHFKVYMYIKTSNDCMLHTQMAVCVESFHINSVASY